MPLYTHGFFDRDFPAAKAAATCFDLSLCAQRFVDVGVSKAILGIIATKQLSSKLRVYAIDFDGGFLDHQIVSGINESINKYLTKPSELEVR